MIGVVGVTLDRVTRHMVVELCPNWSKGACGCRTDLNGQPDPGHPRHAFADTRPPEPRRRADPPRPTDEEWASACAAEALAQAQATTGRSRW